MKKEEFPTFLNEQPTIIFGRTGRELLIIVCGVVASYTTWSNIKDQLPGIGGVALGIFVAFLLVILSMVVALTKIGSRPLEEWLVVWLTYVVMPRVYMYQPLEDEMDEDLTDEKSEPQSSGDTDSLEDD